jgi:hypothetical protein
VLLSIKRFIELKENKILVTNILIFDCVFDIYKPRHLKVSKIHKITAHQEGKICRILFI